MILAIDVGNTNVTIGVFDDERLSNIYRLTTGVQRTSDEYGMSLRNLLSANKIDPDQVTDAIIASVVPKEMHSLTNGLRKYFNVTPIIVEVGIKTGLKILTENPRQLGADRVVDAVGAYELYGGPVIVIDYGTATTYDLVNEKGEFVTGITAPGIRISAKALWEDTAKLPEVEIKKPKHFMAKNTVESMQAGLFYGQIGQTEYIVKKLKEESGYENVKVVATGGLGRLISESTDMIDTYDPDLTLEGLRIIYKKQF